MIRWYVLWLLAINPIRAQIDPLRSEPNTETAADSVITFNEIMYHPSGDDSGLEWIELYNQMSVNMDVSNWTIQSGVSFRFPTNSVFPANSYLVIAADPVRLRALTGLTNIFGPFEDRISNSGERLQLRNNSGRLMDEMTYSDEDPWPVGPDGSGASLSKRDRFNASSPAANWRASAQSGGTPGRINFVDASDPEPAMATLIHSESAARWLVPANETVSSVWMNPAFGDAQWASGTASIGYDTGPSGPTALSNVALRKKVIAGSGAYNNNPFNVLDAGRDFTALTVTDGSTEDIFGQNYWLGREGRINEHFTLDLERSVRIEEIRLRNTHNTQHNDRGTENFEIWAAQSIDASKQLVNPVRILQGRLSSVMGLSTIPADVFAPANGLAITTARYLRFVALTANNPGNNVGLNEIEVFAPSFVGPDRSYAFDSNLDDNSGSGRNGQNFGAAFVTEVPPALGRGQSVEFDGASAQIVMPDSINPDAYTIALWVKTETVRSSSIIVRTDVSGTRSSWSHQLRINGSSRFEHYLFDGSGRSVSASTSIVPGAWNHVVLTAASGGVMRLFVNGVPTGSTVIGAIWPEGSEWRLGSDAGNAPNFFHGYLDDLAIWHTVLDEAAIQALAGGASPTQLGGFHRFFSTDLRAPLYNAQTSAYLRIPFETVNAAGLAQLTLRARYADGFAAFLNGVEVLRRNAPAALAWNAQALANRPVAEAINQETFDLSEHVSKIAAGKNVLAIQALSSSSADSGFLFSAELFAQPSRLRSLTNISFSEIADSYLEIKNISEEPASLAGSSLQSSGGTYRIPATNLAAGAFLIIARTNLGFALADGDRLFLLGAAGELQDAVEVHNRGRGRQQAHPDARWYYTAADTPGTENSFQFHREIVINEVMYHHRPVYRSDETPFIDNHEQWIELHNISAEAVDIRGWRLAGEAEYEFPAGSVIEPGSFLVVAGDAVLLRQKYPNLPITGSFAGRLSHHSGHLILLDATGNPADEFRYHNSHPWPAYSNGGGSSLELRDPRSDNSVPEAWAASVETGRSEWRRYSYRATAVRPVYSPNIFNFHEFRLGLLNEGEALLDNITVTEFPTGSAPRQLLQNGAFATGTQAWRLLGNHSHSSTTNGTLHLVATGNTSYLDNRLETTLKSGGTIVPVVTGREYEISFDAKWLAGSPQLHTELYYNKVAETTILEMPALSGTPGQTNSIYVANTGPTYSALSHSPIVPRAGEAIRVSVTPSDPDGLGSIRLFYSVNAGPWRTLSMTAGSDYAAVIPAQVNGAVIQFYVEGADSLGAVSTYPAGGANSRALIRVDSPRSNSDIQVFRTIMTQADSAKLHSAINMMSDDLLGCTVVHNEREAFYDARIRLHGSMFSRNDASSVGLTVKFPSDHRFRGSRESVVARRRGLIESITKHILNAAGGIPGNIDDVVQLVSHRSDNQGLARLNLANYDDTYVESQFEGDDEGTVFKLEGIREYQTTQNGNPEGLKVSQPIGWIIGFDIADFGDDSEQYRWGIMIQSDRRRDDYSSIVRMGKAMSLTGAPLRSAAEQALDVNSWARLFALQSLLGIGDVYGVDNPHNFAFYARPSDGRVVALQNDWEFAFGVSSGASIYGNKNVYKMLRTPGIQRLYQGHLLDLIDTVVNATYLTPWAQHYNQVFGGIFGSVPSYAAARANSVRRQLAPAIPFEITTNGGAEHRVDTPFLTLEGRGWINVFSICREGMAEPLQITWIDDQRWRSVLPLADGTNQLHLVAYNFRGEKAGEDTIVVSTSAHEFPQRDFIRISEIMYHPPPPTLEEAAARFLDENDFEFIELVNAGPAPVSLLGVQFTVGISFSFADGAITNLSPGEHVLVVKNRAAFEFRHGTNLPVAGEYEGSLANSGERIRLEIQFGDVIHDFTYGDAAPWPTLADGGGRSLEAKDLNAQYSDSLNWQASTIFMGTPGQTRVTLPEIESLAITAGQMHLVFRSSAGRTYEILVSADLGTGQWELLKRFDPEPSGRVETVFDPIDGTARFYRIVSY